VDHLNAVETDVLEIERFASILDEAAYTGLVDAAQSARSIFANRRIFNVNSTARGGGVAEMLRSLLAYARGAGIDTRWLVVGGDPGFFAITKRIHNRLHGAEGDGGVLGADERLHYEATLEPAATELAGLVAPGDIIVLHDPQTAGLIPPLSAAGHTVVWRCHVGLDMPNDLAREAWRFLIPFVEQASAYVFSREAFAWEGLDETKMTVIAPSIDAFSPKNQDMDTDTVQAILATTGLSGGESQARPVFTKLDGTEGVVGRPTEWRDGGTPPAADDRVVVQVSRWDRLKDPVGVIQGFADFVAPRSEAHLIVAGPAVAAVSDDPEGAEVLEEAYRAWEALDDAIRPRVHLACIPMDDGDENAAIVNALQQRADVIVQKSLAEGFGLTVAEGMWKGRPVVASRIGGIQDQITDGETGILIDDPADLESYGNAVHRLLDDPDLAARMGTSAKERVRHEFLGPRHLIQYVDLLGSLL
jgi:trehalose synthase